MDQSPFSNDDSPESTASAMSFARSRRSFGRAPGNVSTPDAPAGSLGMKWSALHDAAAIVAAIASVETPATTARIRQFPVAIGGAIGWRRQLVEQGVEDLSAILEPGLAALLAVHARGANPQPAALALWQEFVTARNAVLDLAPPPPDTGPQRPA